MNDRAVREIAQRLSLRAPQREALTTLGKLTNALDLPAAVADRRAFTASAPPVRQWHRRSRHSTGRFPVPPSRWLRALAKRG
jgi:hypothetical protein